jgi:PAS domain S-box-containing protein
MAVPAAALFPASPTPTPAPAAALASLLLVDDTPANLFALEAMLAPLGARLVQATSGEEALRRVLEEDFAAILMDVRMGGMSGVEATSLIRKRERTRNTPIILMTAGEAEEAEALEAYAHGAVDFLRKPFPSQVLLSKVGLFVELFLAREEVRRQAALLRERELERLQRAHQERLHEMLLQAPAAIAITRGERFVFEFTNPLYEQVVGRKVRIGAPLSEALPEVLEQPGVMEALLGVMRRGETFTAEEFRVDLVRGGATEPEEAFFNLRYVPLREADGRVTGLLTHAVEVTSQVRARRAVEAAEARFRAVTEGLPQLVWTARPDGFHDYFNQRWYDYTGLSREASAGEGWQSPFHPDDLPEAGRRWRHSLQTGEPYEVEYRCRRHDGAWRWFLGRALPVRDAQGAILQWLGTCTDIEEQKRAVAERERAEREVRGLAATLEERVRERTAQLQETNRELESFSYSVSHDLRAPLRHIVGFAQLLERRAGPALDATALGHLRTISEAAQQGGRLVDDLLAFSRMGRAELRQSRVALGPLVEEVRAQLAPEAQGRRVVWEVGPLPEVRADPAMLRLVLHNLLSNALKYTRPREEARLWVAARRLPGGEVEVEVADNGVGFEMEYVDKLFGVFQRLHTAEQFEGTGIGLANVRRIISRHGGRTWARGEVGKGAAFGFTLPAAAPAPGADAAGPAGGVEGRA